MCNSLSTVTVVQPESVTLASDHLPARPTGQWVQGKNYYLCRYLDIMTHGVVKKWEAKLAYVDLFAGPGRSIIRDTGEEVEGSPVLSLKYEFAKYIFVDKPEVLSSLSKQCRRRAMFSRTRSARQLNELTNQPRKCRSDTSMARILAEKTESSCTPSH